MQDWNIARAAALGDDPALAKHLAGHYDFHWRLWEGIEEVASRSRRVGATVFLEWPKRCRYWAESRIVEFLDKLGFEGAIFDGCMYGLTPSDSRKQHLR
eukprot:8975659-Alexandrium_andersonii.AAC.1